MQETPNIKYRNRKLFIWTTGAVSLLLMAFWGYYTVMSVRSVNAWIQSTNESYGLSGTGEEETTFWEYEAYAQLQKENAFLKARLQMASKNTIGLSLNLSDSTIALEISGVTVSTVGVSEFRKSRSLKGLESAASAKLFSEPMKIAGSGASIEKEPVIEKIAPKTAEEAAIPDQIPDTAKSEPVFFELWFENGLRLLVLQQENETRHDRKNRRHFIYKRAIKRTAANIKSVLRLKKPEYHPEILIMIPASDARAVYRAIPENGLVAIML